MAVGPSTGKSAAKPDEASSSAAPETKQDQKPADLQQGLSLEESAEIHLPLIRPSAISLRSLNSRAPVSPLGIFSLENGLPSQFQKIQTAKLSEEHRTELLSKLTPEQKLGFIREEKLRDVESHLGDKESRLLRNMKLSTEQLDAVLETLESKRTFPINSNLSLSLGSLNNQDLLSMNPLELGKLSSVSNKELIGAMSLLSNTEEAQLDPQVRSAILSRLSSDPNAILEIQQNRFHQDHILSPDTISRGALTNSIEAREKYNSSWSPEFFSNAVAGYRKEAEGFSARHYEASGVERENREILEHSLANRRLGQLLDGAATKDPRLAKELKARAAESYTLSSVALFEAKPAKMDTSVGVLKIREAGKNFRASARNWDRTEKTLRTVRNASVVIVAGGAATLAAPVIFAAGVTATGSATISFGGTVLAGSAIGTTTAGGLSLVSGGLEAGGHIALGNKTEQEAYRDFAKQLREDAYKGAIAGAGSGAAGAVSKVLAPAADKLDDVATWVLVRNGAVSSGAAGATSFATDTTVRITQARAQFSEQFAAANLSEEQLAVKYAEFMKQQGLDWSTLSKQGGMSVAFAAFFGGTGARFQVSREAANQANAGMGKHLAIEASEWSLSSVAGFGRAYFETPADQRTFENLMQRGVEEMAHNTASSFQGRASHDLRIMNRELSIPGFRTTKIVPATESSSEIQPPKPPTESVETVATKQSTDDAFAEMILPKIVPAGNDGASLSDKQGAKPSYEQLQANPGDRAVPGGDVNAILFPNKGGDEGLSTSGTNRIFPNSDPETAVRLQTNDEPELAGVGAGNSSDPLTMGMAKELFGGGELSSGTGKNNEIDIGGEAPEIKNSSGSGDDGNIEEPSITIRKNKGGSGDDDPSQVRKTSMTEEQALELMSDFVDGVREFSVREQAEMAIGLKELGIFEEYKSEFSKPDLEKIESAEIAVLALKGTTFSEEKLATTILRLKTNTDLSSEDILSLYASDRRALEVSVTLSNASRLAENDVEIRLKDLSGGPGSEDRLKKAITQLDNNRDSETVAREFEQRRAVDGKIANLKVVEKSDNVKKNNKQRNLTKEEKVILTNAIEKLYADDAFIQAHSMTDVLAIVSNHSVKSRAGTPTGLETVQHLAKLSGQKIDGVDRLFENINDISKGVKTGDISGFFREAEAAVKLSAQGHRIEKLSASEYDGETFWVSGENKPREIDIIVRMKSGELRFVEVKSGVSTFLDKNKVARGERMSKTQLVVQARIAKKAGAVYEVLIADTSDLARLKPQLNAVIDTAVTQGLLPTPPLVRDADGNVIR